MNRDSIRDKINKIKEQINRRCNKTYNFVVKSYADEKMQVFGWAMISEDEEGNVVVDRQGDIISQDELEKLAYNYVAFYGDAGTNHVTSGDGYVIESFVSTREKQKALGISLPVGWWVGIQITNPSVWEQVKRGEYTAFSIEGTAEREEVEV